MTPKRKQRLFFSILLIVTFSLATVLILYSFEQNLLYFYTPTQLANNDAPKKRSFNVGGLVVAGSVKRHEATVIFDVSDSVNTVSINYTGLLPDLFREGQGIVATGYLNENGLFIAERVLAKHDENYMPPEIAAALKQAKSAPIGIKL